MWRSYLQRFVLLTWGQIIIFPYSRTAYATEGDIPRNTAKRYPTHQAASFVRLEILTLPFHRG